MSLTALLVWWCMLSLFPHVAGSQPGGESPAPVVADALEPPELVSPFQASYPEQAQGLAAVVVLEIDVSAEGQVEQARVVSIEPPSAAGYGFEEAALTAVRALVFKPARQGGQPIPVRLNYRARFEPPAPLPPPEPEVPPEAEPSGVLNLAGQLRERGTRDPVVGAQVMVVLEREGEQPEGYEAETDDEGRFGFVDLRPGMWRLLVDVEGYEPTESEVEVVADQRTNLTVYVEPQVNAFDVTVAGQRPRTEVSRVPLSRKEIESVPGTFGDPLNVVPNLPGVARAPFASGEIVVRGSDTDDSGALVEGGPILSVFHFGGIRSVIPAGMLEGVDFYPGNFSARYGQRTGGILNVRLRDLRPEAVHGYVDVNLFDAGFYVETPVGEKGAVAVAGRRSYIDVVLNAVVDDDAINIISAPRYYDGQILATWRPNPDHTLRLFVLGTDDRFELVSNNIKDSDPRASSGRFRSQESFQMTSLTDTYTPNARLTQKLLVGGSIYGGDADFGGLFITSSLYEGFAREVLSYRAHPAMTLHVGGDALVAFGRLNARIGDLGGEGQPGSTPQDNVRDIKGSQWFRSGGLFAELELRPWTRLLIVPGVRADVQRWNEELTFDPRLTTRLTLTPTVTAKAGVGLYQQSPEVAEVFDQFGNPDLRSERAVHTSAGLEWQPLPFLTLDATAFHKALDRLVVPSDAVVERNGQVEPLRFDNSGKGRVVGAEFLLRQRLAYGLMGWVSYTISRSERFNPETGRYRLFDIDQTHVLTVVGSYQLPWNLELGVRYRMASGNPETPVAGAALDADQDQYLPLYGPLNSARKPMFHQLDLRLDKHWVFNTWRLTTYLDVQNVTNHTNVEEYQYNYNYTDRAPVQGLPIIPALGVKAAF